MNPKLTITVDAKNRALSVASGMITVGAKIDIEISGLPGDIPSWGASDAFSGPSARFRLVDECGRDLARYPLAEGDGWEHSGGVLSSITPVEFDTDRLRSAFRGVAFDDTLSFGVIVDSSVDAAQYAVGRVKVRQWAAASTEDPTVLPDWRETLDRLQKDLAEVSEKRDDAVAAKAAAVSAASEAQSSRNEAAASASSALAAKNDAEAARDRVEEAYGNFDGRLKDYAKKEDVKSDLASKADLVDGKVPAYQLPSYVDEVLEYDSVSSFPATGEDGRIFVAKDTNLTYRWSGTQYVEISPSLALGETSKTAYPGDKGKASAEKADAAYSAAESLADGVNSLAGTLGTHTRDTNNPHKVTAAQVGALPIIGGTLTGDLAVGEEHTASRKLTVSSDITADGITLRGGGNGSISSVDVGGSIGEGGNITVHGGGTGGGTIIVGGSPFTGGKLTVQGGGKSGGIIEVTEAGASIKKNGKEVATEEQVNVKADKATTLSGYGITDAATMASLAPEYSPSSAYSVGSFVYHDGNIYQCTTAIADGGEAWNAAHWELRKLDDFFTESNSLLTGTIDARLPYPINAVPSTGVLKDRTLNTTSLASVTVPDNFTDLLVRASVASSLSVTMPEAITTKYGDTFPGEAGEYLITITKTGEAEAYVRTIKLEEVANA